MRNSIVIGLGFGDEGKGRTVDFLVANLNYENTLTVRYSGGQQAGHTVVLNGVRHVFSNFGSGSLRGVPTYWSEFCTVDPVGIINELDILLEKGIKPKLYINPDSPVTIPFDKYISKENRSHGTCGTGVGNTFARNESFYSITAMDLLYRDVLEMKLKLANEKYYKHYKYIKKDSKYDKYDELKRIEFLNAVQRLITSEHIEIVTNIHRSERFSNIIFESSQGLLLDQHYGFFPHVTRSNVGTTNINHFYANDDYFDAHVYLVTRAYQTRHGNGPMTNESISFDIIKDPNETNKTEEFQGEFRRSMLDLDLLKYAINKDRGLRTFTNKTLVITCLDHIAGNWAFTKQGTVYRFISEESFINEIKSYLGIHDVIQFNNPENK